MDGSKTVYSVITSTPADINVKLLKNDGVSKPVNKVNYQSMVRT